MPDVYRFINGRWQGITQETWFNWVAQDLQVVRLAHEAKQRLLAIGINPDLATTSIEVLVPGPEAIGQAQASASTVPGTMSDALDNAVRACGDT